MITRETVHGELKKVSCNNEEHLEYITELEAVLEPDENGEAVVVGSQEVAIGNWCHLRKEYNVDCSNCKIKKEETNEN